MELWAKFVLTLYLGWNISHNSDFACLQIPTESDLGVIISLNARTLICLGHRCNIAVRYRTINDCDEMGQQIKLGCDCIMTDDLMLVKQILEEYR